MKITTQLSELDLTQTYSYADYITWQFDEMVELIKGKIMTMSPAPKDIYTVVQPDLCVICNTDYLDEQGCNGAPVKGMHSSDDYITSHLFSDLVIDLSEVFN